MTDDAATHWRELADSLTAEQAARLAATEASLAEKMPTAELDAVLLAEARGYVTAELVGSALADLAAPACAEVGPWEQNAAGGWYRELLWRDYGREPVGVAVDGGQDADGRVTRAVGVYLYGRAALSAAEARELACTLSAAADELDQLGPPRAPRSCRRCAAHWRSCAHL
jgi:hypothetical protein